VPHPETLKERTDVVVTVSNILLPITICHFKESALGESVAVSVTKVGIPSGIIESEEDMEKAADLLLTYIDKLP
jgi:hypothetical protein